MGMYVCIGKTIVYTTISILSTFWGNTAILASYIVDATGTEEEEHLNKQGCREWHLGEILKEKQGEYQNFNATVKSVVMSRPRWPEKNTVQVELDW